MDLKQLRYLTFVADELNFTRAAERAHVAQPALSRQIMRLEDELGVPLVSRTSRRVRMTPAGTELVERARQILADVEEARAAVDATAALVRGRLTIGVTQSPGPVDVVALLAEYHAQYPGVELVVREELSHVVADRLRADEIDVGLISVVAKSLRDDLLVTAIASEPLMLIVATDHRFASAHEIELRHVARDDFVLFPAGATIRTALLDYATTLGVRVRVAFESCDPVRMRGIVASGLAVGVLPATDVSRPGPEVVAVGLKDSSLTHDVFIAHRARRRLSPAAQAFIELVTVPTVQSPEVVSGTQSSHRTR